jgi:hypothetical protein
VPEQYDLFRVYEGAEVWVEAVTSLVEARRRVKELNAKEPGEYFIFDQKKSERIRMVS